MENIKLYFAYLTDWFGSQIVIDVVDAKDNPDKQRYMLKKEMFMPNFPTTYVRYDELDQEIYPALSGCVSLSEGGALQALYKALHKKQQIISRAIEACNIKLTEEACKYDYRRVD